MVYRTILAGIAIVLFGAGLVLPSVGGQSSYTLEVTPVNPNDMRTFPEELICEDVDEIRPGPSWNGITVGSSTLPELQATMLELSDQYLTWYVEGDGSTRIIQRAIIHNINEVYTSHLPLSALVCTQDNIITVLKVDQLHDLSASQLFLSDLLKQFGRPDAVTATNSFPFTVIAFWFEEGIAASTYTANLEQYWLLPNPDDPLYGRITHIIYFPYQEAEGYEERWPYNRTRAFNPYLPPLPEGTMNPFDFDMLMATVTAQPSRTSTPTFVPLPTSTPAP
jgi:hypothetical protein